MSSPDQLPTDSPLDPLSRKVSPDQLSTEPPSFDKLVEALERDICSAHFERCDKVNGISSLRKEDTVYHLYCDGTNTMQKGDELYGRRTEFINGWNFEIPNIPKIVLPLTRDDHTYAILTLSECEEFRKKMEALARQNL